MICVTNLIVINPVIFELNRADMQIEGRRDMSLSIYKIMLHFSQQNCNVF
jgi:hypothetical protein